MKSVSIVLCRLALAMWIGGAVLFVVTSIAEQTSPHFDATSRDLLATIRFPYYYTFGAACLSTAAVSGCAVVLSSSGRERRRFRLVFLLTLIAAGVAAADYQQVYKPLQAEITPPGLPRSARFAELHRRSTHVNEIHIGLALLAAIIATVPCYKPNSDRSIADACSH